MELLTGVSYGEDNLQREEKRYEQLNKYIDLFCAHKNIQSFAQPTNHKVCSED